MPYTKKSIFSYDEVNQEIHSINPTTVCPMCNRAISPIFISLTLNSRDKGTVMFFCNACSSPFVSYFNYYKSPSNSKYYFKSYYQHSPQNFTSREFSDVIHDLSERFVTIYNQAAHSETLGLFEIDGPGYRKALEILIKDYAKRKYPNDEKKICASEYTLSQCINDFISDERIKNSSRAAAWIGNDATHYLKKHEDMNLSDLKNFIDTVVYFIQYDLHAASAFDFVSKK